MTRSRAKAVEEKQQSQVITTAGAKAAAAKTTKRKTRAEDEEPEDETLESESAIKDLKQPSYSQPTRSTRGRAKANDSAPTTKANGAPASKARGQGKAATVKKDQEDPPGITSKAANTRTTRAKAASEKQAPVSKRGAKKVTFQDEQDADKENLIDPRPNSQHGKENFVGEKASAMSKAPRKARGATAKAAKPTQKAKDTKPRGEPLSPKKVGQVAKGNATQEAAPVPAQPPQSPLKLLSQSPHKPPVSPQKSPTKPSSESATEAGERKGESQSDAHDPIGADEVVSTLAGSPPKRPPPSPVKVSMRDSPRKLNLGTPLKKQSASPTKDLKASCALAQTPARRPPSPIKLFQDQSNRKQAQTPGSTLKTSLLQSPAKRPPSSIKPFSFVDRTLPEIKSTPRVQASISAFGQNPQSVKLPATSSLTRTRDIGGTPSTKKPDVPRMTAEERDDMLIDELLAAPLPFTPGPRVSESVAVFDRPQEHLHPPISEASETNEDLENPPLCSVDEANPEHAASSEVNMFEDTPVSTGHEPSPVGNPSAAFQLQNPPVQLSPVNDSEDELMSDDPKYDASPTRKAGRSVESGSTNRQAFFPFTPTGPKLGSDQTLSMTGLAERFGGWAGATPDTRVLEQRKQEGSIFSLTKAQTVQQFSSQVTSATPQASMTKFEEAIQIHEDGQEQGKEDAIDNDKDDDTDMFRQSCVSDASQSYGDENGTPIAQNTLRKPSPELQTCTPQRLEKQMPRVLHTVSKVPLKAPADDGNDELAPDAKANMKKRRSLATALTPRADIELQALRQIYPRTAQGDNQLQEHEEAQSAGGSLRDDPATPQKGSPTWSLLTTPARTPRSDVNSQLLTGAMVFVDVHTSEGADASGIFVDLLQQMGATVRSTWPWNPSFEDSHESPSAAKIGITHVVFKDGGKRTMEKVRMAKGAVMCVGVGWVLDCERENKRLDEANYTIDTSFVPRGGHRRRKSMEPKMLSNMNGTLSKTTDSRKSSPQPSSRRRVTIAIPSKADEIDHVASVPTAEPAVDESDTQCYEDSEDELAGPSSPASCKIPETPGRPNTLTGGPNSPTTPYFLHPTQLVQQTCPPKQSQESLFPLSGRIRDQPDESLRQRLTNARRKSLQFAPKVKSPLSQDF
ncbi:MAG: hypothetical protein Q9162_001956 [Coniocarpon cinnabarinum]